MGTSMTLDKISTDQIMEKYFMLDQDLSYEAREHVKEYLDPVVDDINIRVGRIPSQFWTEIYDQIPAILYENGADHMVHVAKVIKLIDPNYFPHWWNRFINCANELLAE